MCASFVAGFSSVSFRCARPPTRVAATIARPESWIACRMPRLTASERVPASGPADPSRSPAGTYRNTSALISGRTTTSSAGSRRSADHVRSASAMTSSSIRPTPSAPTVRSVSQSLSASKRRVVCSDLSTWFGISSCARSAGFR